MNLHDFITLMILPIGNSRTNEIQYIKYTKEYIPKLQIHQHSIFNQEGILLTQFINTSLHYCIIIKVGSSSSLLPLSRANGAISQFYLSQEVLQSQPFFMLVVGLPFMQVLIFFSSYIHRYGRTHLLPSGERPQHLHPLAWQYTPTTIQGKVLHLHLPAWQWQDTPTTIRGKALHLHLTMGGPAYHHVGRAHHLHLNMGGTNPFTMSKRHSTYI